MNSTEAPLHLGGAVFVYGRFDISHFVLSLMYLALAIYTAVMLFKLVCGRAAIIRWQRLFLVLSFVAALGRVVYFACAIPVREAFVVVPSHVLFVLSSAPAFLYSACYLIVLFVWIELHVTAGQADLKDPEFKIQRTRPIFLTIVALIWVAVVTLYVVDFAMFETKTTQVSTTTNLAEMVLIVFIALLYLATAIAFLIYGSRFYAELRRSGSKMFTVHSRRQRIVLEVQVITLVITLCFLIRGALTIWQIFLQEDVSASWYADLLYFSFLEFLPILMLTIILRPRIAVPNYVVVSSDTFSPLINTSYR
jgi:hypothetical protein